MRALLIAIMLATIASPSWAQGRDWTADRFTRCVRVERFDELSTERHASTEPCRTRSQVVSDDSSVTIGFVDPFVAETASRSDLGNPAFAVMFDASYETNNNVFVQQGYGSADFYRAVFILNGQQHDREFALSQDRGGGCGTVGRGLLRTNSCSHRELMLLALTPDDLAAIRQLHANDAEARITFRLHSRNAGTVDVWISAAEVVGIIDRSR